PRSTRPRIRTDPVQSSSRCGAASILEFSQQFRRCRTHPCHAVPSVRATTPAQDCETPRQRSARGLREDRSSSLLHRSAGNLPLLPSTPPSIPELETRPAPFESPPPDPPPVSFVQTYPPAFASHPLRPAL